MEMISCSYARFVLKVRVFGTGKWHINIIVSKFRLTFEYY